MPKQHSEVDFQSKFSSFPTRLRVLVILQLCLAFTLLIFYAGYPFLAEIFEIKSKLIVYESVTTKSDPEISALFSSLPLESQGIIAKNGQCLYEMLGRPFSHKLCDALRILLWEIPPFERAWLLFAIVISILLLLRFEGASRAVWLLPLIVIAHGCDLAWRPHNLSIQDDRARFPSEEYICHHYLLQPLSSRLSEQKTQLFEAWQRYLICEWTRETPSNQPETFLQQTKKGLFLFNAASLLRDDFSSQNHGFGPVPSTSSPLLILYFLWNAYFAWQLRLLDRKTPKLRFLRRLDESHSPSRVTL